MKKRIDKMFAVLVQTNHEGTIATFWVCFAVVVIGLGLIVGIGLTRSENVSEQEKTKRTRAEADAAIATATEKQVNGRGPEDYLKMAEASERQAEALEHFLIAQEKFEAFLKKQRDYVQAAKDLIS